MRTLLDASFPPTCMDDQTFSPPELLQQPARIFSQSAVLAKENNLVEVGVGGTVIAAPGAPHADSANGAPGRGMAFRAVQQPKLGDVSL